MSTPGPVQRLFNSFADALGRQALPTLVSWLQTRLGDGVVIKDFRTEGSRVYVADAVLPLGPAAILRVDEACFRLHPRAVLGAPVASLQSLRGVLFVPHHEGDGTTFWAPVEFAQSESPTEDSWIDGTLSTTGAHWTESAGLGEQAPLDGTLSLLVTSQNWSLRSAELTAGNSTIVASGSGALGESERTLRVAELQVTDARVGHFIDAMVALLGRTIGFGIPIPKGALLGGSARMTESGEFKASMALRSSRSKLQLETDGTLEKFDSLRLLGFIALDEVLASGSDLSLGIDCKLQGPLRGPDGVAQIQLGPHELEVTVQTQPKSFSFSHATAALLVELAQIFDFRLALAENEPRYAPKSGFAIPHDALIDATLVYDKTIFGSVTVRTERTTIRVDPLEFDPKTRDFGESRVKGTLEANDAVAIGMFPSPLRPWEGTADLNLALRGSGKGTYVEGTLEAESLSWALLERAPAELKNANADLRIDARAVTIGGLAGDLLGGSIVLDLEIVFPVDGESSIPTGRLLANDLCQSPGQRAGLGAWLEELIGTRGLPTQLHLNAKLESDERGALLGPVTLVNPRSQVDLGVQVSSKGALDGTQISAKVDLSDLSGLLSFESGSLVGTGPLSLSADLKGTGKQIGADLQLQSDSLRVAFCRPGLDLPLSLTALKAALSIDGTETILSSLSVGVCEGTLFCEARKRKAAGLEGSLKIQDLEVSELPVSKEKRVGSWIAGRLQSTFALKKKPESEFSARGTFKLTDANYKALRQVQPKVLKYGLSKIHQRATRPLEGEVGIKGTRCTISNVSAATRSGSLRASAHLSPDHVNAEGTLTLPESYLSESDLLRIPASLVGDVSVPFVVQGPIKSPKVKADVMGALDGIMKQSAIGESFRRVSTVLDEWAGGKKHSAPAPEAPKAKLGDLDVDELVNRIAGGSPDHDSCLDELLERGLSPDDIADRIDEAEERMR